MLCTKVHDKYAFNSPEFWPLLEHKLLEDSFLHSLMAFLFSCCDKIAVEVIF